MQALSRNTDNGVGSFVKPTTDARAHLPGSGKKLGWTGYAEIIARLIDAPVGSKALCAETGIQIQTVRRIFGRLHDLRVVHVVAWERAPRGSAAPVYAWGCGQDVPSPNQRPGVARGPLKRSSALPELVQVVQFVRMLSQPDPVSITQLSEDSGSAWNNVRRFVLHCQKLGIVHIGAWGERVAGGAPARLYSFGRGANVPRPKPTPRSVIEKRSREARKAKAEMLTMIAATAANAGRIKEAA